MRVLSIDGGGIRGIIPALVLAEVESRTGRRAAELFDLVAGTSTGGILACALTRADPQSAAELVELYRTEGPKIFRRSLGQRVRSAGGLLEEKHDDAALDDALSRYLGSRRLSDATTRVLVTAYDLQGRQPYFFKSWREDRDGPLRVVARATAAAPTYFEPVEYGGRSLIDGGVFATNPAMCAYARPSCSRAGRRTSSSASDGRQTRRSATPTRRAGAWSVGPPGHRRGLRRRQRHRRVPALAPHARREVVRCRPSSTAPPTRSTTRAPATSSSSRARPAR
jgi:predicted acylesterase/phospholipase RssA